uniref:Putative E3 ubiquitin-protein ligase UBR7 n=1 Tax=Riptortus pedestris TaxID=329032 RepID=R4WE97_RIPPE|nr:conserved hypothetical protein [Riptortus pedestris]
MAENSETVQKADEENSMTLDDFLEEELQLQSDANAVLGSSDDKNCTYNSGYLQRQALYACMTCTPQADPDFKPAGICLACSYHCHEGHDLVELYTKRFFRCDCGNSRFHGKKCNLEPSKTEDNEKNTYNQNFKGLYCTCARPYPDPEDDVPDEMIQCIICEDWYHTRHLKTELPPEGNYAEMICGSCTDRLTFLKYYLGLAVVPISKNEPPADKSESEINVSVNSGTEADALTNGLSKTEEEANESEINKAAEASSTSNDDAIKNVAENACVNGTSPPSDKPSLESKESCRLENTKEVSDRVPGSATFWSSNLRSSLCSCSSCKNLYADLNVAWILDESDTVQAYEEKGKQTAETIEKSRYEEGMKELAKLNRFQQAEVIQNYNDFKSSLSEFLGKFVQQKKVVRKEDIDEFFVDMQAKKRQKVGTPPYTCH